VPVQLLRTRDGWIFVMCMTPKFWDALVGALGHPELGADPRFASTEARRAHRDELTTVLDSALSEDTTANWLERLRGLLPVAPVHDLSEALDNPFAAAVGMVRTVPHPRRADFRVLANPVKLDGRRPPSRSAPELGADTETLLIELGYTAGQIAALRQGKTV